MVIILKTDRLVLRQFTVTDTKFIVELVNTPGWIEFIGDRGIKTDEQAKDYLLNGPLKSYELNGFGLYMVELKNKKLPVGMCGIIKRDSLKNPDIGFAFLPAFNGKGLALEIVKATLEYARDNLKLPLIYAITLPQNTRSIKVLEKIGMKSIGLIADSGEDLLLYSN
jgi:RimJ/RimL family protein N-acetyltransferase